VRSADRDGGAKGDDEMANVLNSLEKGRISILLPIRNTPNTSWSWTDLGPGYHASNARSTHRDLSQNAQYFNPK